MAWACFHNEYVIDNNKYLTGLEIVYSLDEVAFVQNLVFYIETAYRTPVRCFKTLVSL